MISLYLIIFCIIAICAIVSLLRPCTENILYYLCLVGMTIFLTVRFGQGPDYPGYMCIYEMAEVALAPGGNFVTYLNIIHGEIGWKLMMVLFKMMNAEFWMITMLIAVGTMTCTHLAIKEFCKDNKIFALLLLYPTIYLTYYFSGLRQGIAMAVFLGIFLKQAINKKYVNYIIGVMFLSTIHKASIIYLIVPVTLALDWKYYIAGTVFSLLFAVGMFINPVRTLVNNIAMTIGASGTYFGEPNVSWFSLAERLIMLGLVAVMVWKCRKSKELMQKSIPLLKIYYLGFLIYICLLNNSFVASRLAIMFKIIEIILIPILLNESGKIRYLVGASVMSIALLMTYKNLKSYVAQGDYYHNVTVWNYPYITIFNQKSILQYRKEYVNMEYDFRESIYLN